MKAARLRLTPAGGDAWAFSQAAVDPSAVHFRPSRRLQISTPSDQPKVTIGVDVLWLYFRWLHPGPEPALAASGREVARTLICIAARICKSLVNSPWWPLVEDFDRAHALLLAGQRAEEFDWGLVHGA